jgi:signal transduction histidine kinase
MIRERMKQEEVIHEIKNYLCSIMGNAELLLLEDEDGKDEEQETSRIRKILQTARQACSLIGTLNGKRSPEETTGEDAAELETRDVNRSIAELLCMIQGIGGRGVGVKLALARDPLPVRLRLCQLEALLFNLVANARDSMPGGGIVSIRTAFVSLDTFHHAAHRMLDTGRYACIQVSDTGHGIQPRDVGSIFEPYFTTRQGGQGLGLFTCLNMVKQLGGTIDVRSVPGEGSTFSVYLPVAGSGEERPGLACREGYLEGKTS